MSESERPIIPIDPGVLKALLDLLEHALATGKVTPLAIQADYPPWEPDRADDPY